MLELPTDTDPVKVYQGDCLQLLKELPDGCVDAVITDPPYGIALSSHGTWFRGMKELAGDDSQDAGQRAIDWCFDSRIPVAAFADPLKPWRGDWRQGLAWDKGGAVGIGGDRETCWKRSWELILVSRLFGALNGSRDESVLRFPMMPNDSAGHVATKSDSLMRYLVRKLTSNNTVVLDPFAGSGTTGVACAIEGRRCILIEQDAGYCEIARKRVEKALGREPGNLFAELAGG